MTRYHGGPSETILATADAMQVSVSHSRSLLPGKLQREGESRRPLMTGMTMTVTAKQAIMMKALRM